MVDLHLKILAKKTFAANEDLTAEMKMSQVENGQTNLYQIPFQLHEEHIRVHTRFRTKVY
jgi:hypothetical protein